MFLDEDSSFQRGMMIILMRGELWVIYSVRLWRPRGQVDLHTLDMYCLSPFLGVDLVRHRSENSPCPSWHQGEPRDTECCNPEPSLFSSRFKEIYIPYAFSTIFVFSASDDGEGQRHGPKNLAEGFRNEYTIKLMMTRL